MEPFKLEKTDVEGVVLAAHLIPGWCYLHEMTLMYDLIKDSKFHVEIGSFCGKTTFVAGCAMENGSKILCVDMMGFEWMQNMDSHFRVAYCAEGEETSWPEDLFHISVKAVHKLAPDTEIVLEKKSSIQVAVAHRHEEIDSIYVDGNHAREGVLADILAWYPMLKPGGIMFGHDYWSAHPGVIEAVHEMFGEHGKFPGGFTHHQDTRVWIHKKPKEESEECEAK